MKRTLMAVLFTVLAPGALAEEKERCETNIERSPNLIVEIITIPMKMIATFSHIPRCLIHYFPVNEKEE